MPKLIYFQTPHQSHRTIFKTFFFFPGEKEHHKIFLRLLILEMSNYIYEPGISTLALGNSCIKMFSALRIYTGFLDYPSVHSL